MTNTVHRIICGTGNCYVVSKGQDAILVDTGRAEFIDKVTQVCDKYDMKLIVLTHTHFDHAENAAALSERYGIPVAYHKADDALFEDSSAQPLSYYGITGRIVMAMSVKLLNEKKVRRPNDVVFIEDGYDLSGYGVDARIICAPGHTYGSVCVEVSGKGLIVGDAMDNWVLPGRGHLYTDLAAAKASYEKIRALGAETIFYGHGRPTKA
ncbi:MAG: MBL fold metallo-hydrolase [Oscillospiraceae bacterium]|nr:MBL fold metallo-hydrolase [Oscillospiraceae bacterium]